MPRGMTISRDGLMNGLNCICWGLVQSTYKGYDIKWWMVKIRLSAYNLLWAMMIWMGLGVTSISGDDMTQNHFFSFWYYMVYLLPKHHKSKLLYDYYIKELLQWYSSIRKLLRGSQWDILLILSYTISWSIGKRQSTCQLVEGKFQQLQYLL